jgi:hypothetical protein
MVPRIEIEAWLHDFVHELRNHLNNISLEAANLADVAGNPPEAVQLQMKIQICGAYLKLIRDGIAPDQPRFERATVREILEETQARGLGSRLVWPPNKEEVLDKVLGLDKYQVGTALELLLRDAQELAGAPTEPMTLSWAEAFISGGVGLHLSFRPSGEFVPVEVARWGKAFDGRVGGLLRRYQINRLLELNGGCAAWTYVKSGEKRFILAHVEFASVADVSD